MALLKLALMAVPASAVLLLDTSAATSRGETRTAASAGDDAACDCLPWYWAYKGVWQENENATEADPGFAVGELVDADGQKRRVNGTTVTATCGDGHEMMANLHDLELGQEPVWDPWREFCQNFFLRLQAPYADCMNVARTDNNSDEVFGGQWCYVRPACPTAFAKRPDTLKIKKCEKGRDPFFWSRKPAELFNMSQEMNLDISTLVKMAYPVMKRHSIAPDVVVDGRVIDVGPLEKAFGPVVLDSNTSRPPFVVQDGYSQYHVIDNMDHMRAARPMTFTEFVCANTSYEPCKDSLKVNWKKRSQAYSWK